jgi:hypothetical protein
MTRQPADENRLTVAWPIPREAPVSISVLRSALERLGMDRLVAAFALAIPSAF